MFPVFSLVLDEDVPSDIALIYPELYKDLSKVGNKNLHYSFKGTVSRLNQVYFINFC